ncbi:MAG: dTDP-4-dehydrorhamnose 3,5-epimerase [Chlamydiae bacterium]|nr:dTDP-4-dehydrorhamnose 3,5-epimerase [Chlamydiota bacterium]MBI3266576.1 dTDP-4-dehydrorhamnose 3,5-epimerase [Chlamydiota bacterium]
MKFTRLNIPDVILIEPKVFEDSRGFFYESYREDVFAQNGIPEKFVQDNHSKSQKGTLRGLHYQIEPRAQGKLVRVVKGEVFDVAVDIRRGSKTFGQYVGQILSEENKQMMYVPPGFSHGFLVLKDGTEFVYKCSNFYSASHERGILWNDPSIGIAWPKLDCDYIFSQKDQRCPTLKDVLR